MVAKLKLITQNKLNNYLLQIQLKKFQCCYQIDGYLSFLPLLWQELINLPVKYKNGKNWLLTEKSTILNNQQPLFFSAVKLYLVSETVTSKKKYLVTLELQIYQLNEIVMKSQLTLLSENSWNEILL